MIVPHESHTYRNRISSSLLVAIAAVLLEAGLLFFNNSKILFFVCLNGRGRGHLLDFNTLPQHSILIVMVMFNNNKNLQYHDLCGENWSSVFALTSFKPRKE